MGKPSGEVTERYFLRLTTTKTPTDRRHRGQLCTAGLAALASQQCRPSGALLSLIARRAFGQNAPRTACVGTKSSPTTATHGGFWATFGSHTCSSTKKKPWKLQQATELFLKCNLSVGRMKPICWERNKYQSKFPLACRLIPNWARGSTHLCWGPHPALPVTSTSRAARSPAAQLCDLQGLLLPATL